jgi:hypothetical protein
MYALIKKYRKERASSDPNSSIGMDKIQKYYLFVQDKWAKKMSSATSRFSKRALVCLLVSFVIVTGSIYIGIILDSFSNSTFKIVKIIPLSKAEEAISKSSVIQQELIPISENEFRRITHFRKYLDSLARSPTGKATYDSLYGCRKGLIDSLLIIENYYKSN